MKYLVFLILIWFLGMIIPSFAIEEFNGTATIENLDSVVAGQDHQFNVRLFYTQGPYTLTEITPIAEIYPKDARQYVNIVMDPARINVLHGSVARIYGILEVKPDIPYQKIFLNISFPAKTIYGQNVTSTFNDSTIINIIKQQSTDASKIPCFDIKANHHVPCDPENSIKYYYQSPLKQFKSGLAPADVLCKKHLSLAIKKSTLSPACVKLEHAQRLLSYGWFSIPSSERAIRPLVTVIENKKDLGIDLIEMKVISKQDYGTFHENNLKVTAFQGILSGIPTVVSEITNVNNKTVILNQVLFTGSIVTSPDSTMTPLYADAIGCSVSHWENGNTTCPYPTASYGQVILSPNESFVSYFSDDFTHKLGPINKITTSIWYDLDSDKQHYRTEIDYSLDVKNED